jgi:hypothetical protein
LNVAVFPEMEARSCWKRPSTPRSTRSFSKAAALEGISMYLPHYMWVGNLLFWHTEHGR